MGGYDDTRDGFEDQVVDEESEQKQNWARYRHGPHTGVFQVEGVLNHSLIPANGNQFWKHESHL